MGPGSGFPGYRPPCFIPSSLPASPMRFQDPQAALQHLFRVIVPVLSEEQFESFYSNLFTGPKPSSGIHSIIKFKDFNTFLQVQKL